VREVSLDEATRSIGRPQRVMLAVSVDAQGQADIIPLGWHMQTSFNPLMIAISVGHTRYSHKLIAGCGEFVLAVASEQMADETLFCGTRSGRNVDKFSGAKLTALPARLVKPPLVGEAVANLECRVVSSHETGDHTIFVGEVVAAHASDESRRCLLAIGHETGYRHVGGNERYRFGVVRDE
jgi:flavin reductase (DIM6/NTAB) family NADH-FMN oxidoreductase RutF